MQNSLTPSISKSILFSSISLLFMLYATTSNATNSTEEVTPTSTSTSTPTESKTQRKKRLALERKAAETERKNLASTQTGQTNLRTARKLFEKPSVTEEARNEAEIARLEAEVARLEAEMNEAGPTTTSSLGEKDKKARRASLTIARESLDIVQSSCKRRRSGLLTDNVGDEKGGEAYTEPLLAEPIASDVNAPDSYDDMIARLDDKCKRIEAKYYSENDADTEEDKKARRASLTIALESLDLARRVSGLTKENAGDENTSTTVEAERVRLAAENAEAERVRLAAENAEAERVLLAAENAEAERVALAERVEAERVLLAAENAEAERIALAERVEAEGVAQAEHEEDDWIQLPRPQEHVVAEHVAQVEHELNEVERVAQREGENLEAPVPVREEPVGVVPADHADGENRLWAEFGDDPDFGEAYEEVALLRNQPGINFYDVVEENEERDNLEIEVAALEEGEGPAVDAILGAPQPAPPMPALAPAIVPAAAPPAPPAPPMPALAAPAIIPAAAPPAPPVAVAAPAIIPAAAPPALAAPPVAVALAPAIIPAAAAPIAVAAAPQYPNLRASSFSERNSSVINQLFAASPAPGTDLALVMQTLDGLPSLQREDAIERISSTQVTAMPEIVENTGSMVNNLTGVRLSNLRSNTGSSDGQQAANFAAGKGQRSLSILNRLQKQNIDRPQETHHNTRAGLAADFDIRCSSLP
jgi:hypothetical protein